MKLQGIGASDGIAIARIWRLREQSIVIEHRQNCDREAELARFEAAVSRADEELEALFDKTMETDEQSAMIFDIHRMMLEDPDFCEGVADAISAGHNAEWAVEATAVMLKAVFEQMDDAYMKARAADVQDVSGRIIKLLLGLSEISDMPREPVIVAAEDLLPSQTVKLDKKYVVGYVTKMGSLTSHSAILARSMGIACIVGMGTAFDSIPAEGELIIDGSTGLVISEPTAQEKSDYEAKQAEYKAYLQMLSKYKDADAVTASGHKCIIAANIGSVEDALAAKNAGAQGVGLFRSEFLYLEGDDFPCEEKQFEVYRKVLEIMNPYPVVIRTLDLGSDKQAPYFNIPGEENPAMGYRAIRICLAQPEIFHTQLRALLRAGQYGKLCIMFPMVTGLSQVLEIKEHLRFVEEQLLAEGHKLDKKPEIGIMIETPAAAIMSDVLAPELDFFSIGTNDLTQYTLAADRMNSKVSAIFDAEDPAVLRLIEITAKNAHKAGIWVGICGEAAANTKLSPFFMQLKIDELSMAAASVLKLKKAVIECE